MRFMILVKATKDSEAGVLPDEKLLSEMMKYNEALAKAGVLLSLDGLVPPSAGVRISFSGGKPKVTDGPFAEAKECIGGYWMIQVKSKEEAVEWAKRAPMGDNEIIEVRQVHEMSDFPPDVQAAAAGIDDLLGRK